MADAIERAPLLAKMSGYTGNKRDQKGRGRHLLTARPAPLRGRRA